MAEFTYRDSLYTNESSTRSKEIRVEGSEGFIGEHLEELVKLTKGEKQDSIIHDVLRQMFQSGTKKNKQIEEDRHAELDHDVVAIYDDAGIPSFMHRFRKTTNKELFGGREKVHPAFIIGGIEYDEIYIAVYEGTMINGKIYSLPFTKPVTDISQDEFAEACFSKGEGWHMITAAEWGLLANLCLKNGTLPHGNTSRGSYHGDKSENGEVYECGKVLTGSGPATWTHDHTPHGVYDLCGNIYEMCRGLRMKDGRMESALNNDAALPETDLGENGKDWHPVLSDDEKEIYVDAADRIRITDDPDGIEEGYSGVRWKNVVMEVESENLKELAMYAGEPDSYCYIDGSEGEYCLIRGGHGYNGEAAGVFDCALHYPRSGVSVSLGGRCAYFKKKR